MTEKSPDDVFALFSRFDLNGDSYRVFPKKEPTLRSFDNPQPVAPETTPQELELVADREHSLGVAASVSSEDDDNSPAFQARRIALRNLCRSVSLSGDRTKTASFKDLLKASVFVYATAGGVGSTTITATLARLLARSGRYCSIVDDREDSAMPLFFGQQPAFYDHKRYAGLHAAAESAVRIITRKPVPSDSDTTLTTGQTLWFEKEVAPTQHYLDHLLIDVQRGREQALPADVSSVALIVAAPDVSSLVGARGLKRILSEKAPACKIICVLNKFDSSLALHKEIREWFEENFSPTVTLSRSDLVSEAHAEGLTVVDWAPQSAVTADFSRLLAITQKALTVLSNSKPGELSLCS